jgi:hypothetical protein
MTRRCPATVVWADLGPIEVRCVRAAEHAGWHRDGTRWWDGLGLQQPTVPDPVPAVIDQCVHAGCKAQARSFGLCGRHEPRSLRDAMDCVTAQAGGRP